MLFKFPFRILFLVVVAIDAHRVRYGTRCGACLQPTNSAAPLVTIVDGKNDTTPPGNEGENATVALARPEFSALEDEGGGRDVTWAWIALQESSAGENVTSNETSAAETTAAAASESGGCAPSFNCIECASKQGDWLAFVVSSGVIIVWVSLLW